MVDALKKRHDFFAANGCKLSDHGIEEFYDEDYTDSQIETIFEKAMRGQQLSVLETRQYKHCFLTVMAEMDADSDWTQQFHYGAIRYVEVPEQAEYGGQAHAYHIIYIEPLCQRGYCNDAG